ncbi:MAG: pyridoxal phosphate-dependent aminotransferase [Succinivibrio sp.]
MIQLSERTRYFTDSVIRRMTRVCNQYGAVNLSQGFPDNDPPKALMERLSKVSYDGPHQYAITWGNPKTLDALAAKIEHFTSLNIDPAKELCITCGGTEAMMCAVMATINPGEKIAIFSPFYENYGADSVLCGATPIYVPLRVPDFSFDENELEKAFADGAKALILCNPSNPSGKVFTREELLSIARIVEKYDAFVITDEVYEHIIFEPYQHTYFATLPGMRERTIMCNSLSKTYSITGWRLGYVCAPEYVMDRVRKVHDFLTVGAAAPLQEAVIAGLTMPDSYYQEVRDLFTHRKELFCKGLEQIGFKFYEPQGTYFVMVDIGEFGYESDYEFCTDLAKDVKVGAVPGSSFFKENVNNYMRLHFAKSDDTLNQALDNLSKIRDIIKVRA